MKESLLPEGNDTFLKLAYLVLLGRPIDPATLERESAALARGERTRAAFIREIISSLEFKEAEIVERAVTEGRAIPPGPSWPGTSERVVELPWVVEHIPPRGRLLDVGYAWASWVYLKQLLARPDLDVHGVDLADRWLGKMHRSIADARYLPYRDDVFDVITCVSTVEHVGRDNERYGVPGPRDPRGDDAALREFHRVLVPKGVALVTVPMGKAEDHGWFLQYDQASWTSLVHEAGLTTIEEQAFLLGDDGWIAVDVGELDGVRYGEGCPGARGVLCTALRAA